jgi:hypothetical protein
MLRCSVKDDRPPLKLGGGNNNMKYLDALCAILAVGGWVGMSNAADNRDWLDNRLIFTAGVLGLAVALLMS